MRIMKNTLYFYRWYCYIVCVTTFLVWKHMYYTTPLLLGSLRPQHLRAASLQLDSLLHHHLTSERIFLRQCIPGILGHQGILGECLLVQCILGEGIPRANLTFADIKSWPTHPSGSNCAPSMGNSMQRKQIRTRSKVKVSSEGWMMIKMNGGWMEATTRVVTTLRYLAHLSAGEIVTVPNCQKTLRQKI